MKLRTIFSIAIIIATLLLQIGLIFPEALHTLEQIWKVKNQPSVWRGAMFHQGERFADFILFLRENIPPQNRVILPPASSAPKNLGFEASMQMFLFPRLLLNCTTLECYQQINPEETHLLLVPANKDTLAKADWEERCMFDDEWGLTIPPDSSGACKPRPSLTLSNLELLKASLAPLVWWMLLLLSGALLVNGLSPEENLAFKLSVGYGVILCLWTIGLGTISLLGLQLTGNSSMVVMGILLLCGLWLNARRLTELITWRRLSPPRSLQLDGYLVALCFLGIIAAILAVGKGFSVSDELFIWGVKGYGIAETGSITTVTNYGTNTLAYPLLVPLQVAGMRLLFLEVLPASKVFAAGFYLALLIFIYDRVRHWGLKPSIAGMTTLIPATVPLIFRHASIAYANLPLTFYLVCGITTLSSVLSKEQTKRRKPGLLISTLCLMGAAWSRPEGIVLIWTGILVCLFLSWLDKANTRFDKGGTFFWWPLILYHLYWWAVVLKAYGDALPRRSLVSDTFQRILNGEIHWQDSLHVLKEIALHLISPQTWGGLGIILALAILLALFWKAKTDYQSRCLLASGLSIGTLIWGIYIIASYDTIQSLEWWIRTGLDRMLLPAVFLVYLGMVVLLKESLSWET